MTRAVRREDDIRKFQITIEIHGHSYVITKEASSYYDMVNEVNSEFGNVIILETIDLD